MLKLERRDKSKEIQIVLSHRGSIFNRAMIQAFLLALGIHLGALILFHIEGFKIVEGTKIATPAVVELDVDSLAAVFIDSEAQGGEDSFFIVREPKRGKPAPLVVLGSPHDKENLSESTVFKSIEPPRYCQRDCFSPFEFLDSISKKSPRAIRVLPIAALSGREWSYNETIKGVFESSQRVSSQRVVFAVQVEDSTGEVFWFEPVQINAEDRFVKMAEEIVKTIQFKPSRNSFITAGNVEIFWSEGAG